MAYAHGQYEQRREGSDYRRKEFSGSHVSLGGVKYALGAVVLMLLGERIKNPEQRYLVLAGLSAMVGAIDTAWRDHVRARERAEREASWRERCEREGNARAKERA